MAKINLLPPEAGKVKKDTAPVFSARAAGKLLLIVNILLIAAAICLRVSAWQRSKSLTSVDSEYQQASIVNKKIHTLLQEQSKVLQEFNSLKRLAQRDILWYEELSRLPQIMPEEVWLTSFSFKKKSAKDSSRKILYLRGGLRPPKETSHIVILSKFINQIKEDPVFSADFDTPVLTDSKTENQDTTEIMSFSLEMSFIEKKTN